MSYIISYGQYAPLLYSDDENVIKKALQDLFELFITGKLFARSKKRAFTQLVKVHVNSKSQKVRKWAYHCACYYQDEIICSDIIRQLQFEKNKENIIWALTALSKTYKDVTQLKKCAGQRHDEFMETVSENYLSDALLLFGEGISIDPNRIMLMNKSTDLMSLAKIYAYKPIKYPMISQSVIREEEQSDDPDVREYAYWAQALSLSKGDYFKAPDDPDECVRKWQIAIQIQTGEEDFVESVLKQFENSFQIVSLEVRIGILKGLCKRKYCSKYVPYVNAWFINESDEAVLFPLIDYIIENCSENRDDGTYFDALKDALCDYELDSNLVEHIVYTIESKPQYNLIISQKGEKYILDFRTEGESIVNVGNVNVNGQDINFAIGTDNSQVKGSDNKVVVGTGNSQANAISMQDKKMLELLREVQKQAESGLTREDKEKVTEGISAIELEVKSEKPKKTVIKTILEGFKAIKGTAEFAAAVTSLIQFFSNIL